MPNTTEEWMGISQRYKERWNVPNTLGALDGKHIRIQCPPPNSGSVFYNYKHFYSIVLLALADADYSIAYYDIGVEAKASDGGIWSKCSLKRDIEDVSNPKNIPREGPVEGIEGNMPFYILGDDAFPLMPYLMKTYPTMWLMKPQRIFNYRLSHGRRVIENSFGLLACRFQIYRQEIAMHPDGLERVVRAIIILHNMLQKNVPRCTFPVML